MLGAACFSTAHAISLEALGIYRHGTFGQSAAEISAYDPVTKRLFVVNGESDRIDVLDMSDPRRLKLVRHVGLAAFGKTPNSVAIHGDVAAVAVTANDPQAPGNVVFLSTTDFRILSAVTVGAMPDMIAFTPDGKLVVTADEGEPDETYARDPEGSVSIIDVSQGFVLPRVRTARFDAVDRASLAGVRAVGPKQTFAQDAEPEYLAISPDSSTAYVTLQEANAIAVVDLRTARVTDVRGLGFKDWSASALDVSDKDGVNIQPRPVFGVYQPDAIAFFTGPDGAPFLVTANEGDTKAFGEDRYTDEARVSDLRLDAAIPDQDALKRLKALRNMGDANGDGTLDQLYLPGARSISIWDTAGRLVFDSGDMLERKAAELFGTTAFNADHLDHAADARSDDKGPEPEGVAIGVIGARTYAFVCLERQSAIAVFDVTDPRAVTLAAYHSARDLTAAPPAQAAGDMGPEGITLIPAAQSPIGAALLVISNEISSTTRVYAITP